MPFDPTWDAAALGKELCDTLVAKGQLKEKPAFIRTDREAKIVGIFESIGLDGAKMASFDNPGPLEMLLRKGTNGEAWVQQVLAVLTAMLPESAAKATKKMGMDEDTKAQLEAAKEKTAERRDRLEQAEGDQGGRNQGDRDGVKGDRDGGKGGRDGGKGDRDGGKGDRDGGGKGNRWSDDAAGDDRHGGGGDEPKPFLSNGRWNRDEPDGGDRRGGKDGSKGGGRFDRGDGDGGDRRGGKGGGRRDRDDAEGGERRGGKGETIECYNCGGLGHLGRDCPEPRKDKGKGKGRPDRRDRVCDNCQQPGHKSRDCPEPVNPEAVQRRLDAKAAKEAAKGGW